MSNKPMSHQQIDGSDAENLSALFDGQLGSDAARFALKRLEREADSREACGRWQLAGDVLRGEGVAPAATGFADRVMAAIEHEQEQTALAGTNASSARTRTRHHPRWIGGALAASVAIAALFVARPMLDGDDAALHTSTGQEVVSASPGEMAPPIITSENDFAGAPKDPAPDPRPAATELVAGLAAAAGVVATADAPRLFSDRRRASVGSRGVDGRPARAVPATAVAAASNEPAAPASERAGRNSARPFMPAEAIVSKPWPRAAVSEGAGNAAMTVGFHADGPGAIPISFYPFEPASLRGESSRSTVERAPLPPPLPREPAAGAPTRH